MNTILMMPARTLKTFEVITNTGGNLGQLDVQSFKIFTHHIYAAHSKPTYPMITSDRKCNYRSDNNAVTRERSRIIGNRTNERRESGHQ